MKLNSTYIMLLTLMTISLILITSSTSWLMMWMGMEINLMAFIPILSNNFNSTTPSSSLKYFLTQGISTMIILIAIFLEAFPLSNTLSIQDFLFNIGFLVSLGSSPFHFWIPSVMENLSWTNCFLISTFQKLVPLMALDNQVSFSLLIWIIPFNLITGTLGCINQNSLRKLMGYSSITHTGWLLSGMIEEINYWISYFIIYTFLTLTITLTFSLMNASYINQWISGSYSSSSKIILSTSFLSMSGMPPFLGFLPKWLILEKILKTQLELLGILLILFSLISLFFYLRIPFTWLLFFSSSLKMNVWEPLSTGNWVHLIWIQASLMLLLPMMM